MPWYDRIRPLFQAAPEVPQAVPKVDAVEIAPVPKEAPTTALGTIWSYMQDSIRNLVTGLGTSTDKGSAARPVARLDLTYQELEALYLYNGYATTVIDKIPASGIKPGWVVEGITPEEQEYIKQENTRLSVMSSMDEAWTWARLYGYSVIVMITDDPDYSKPLDLKKLRNILSLQVFDKTEAVPLSIDNDVSSPGYRRPLYWQITPAYGETGGKYSLGRVHRSRVLYVPGRKVPPRVFMQKRGDVSVLESVWDAIRNRTSVDQAGAALSQEVKVSVLTMTGLDAHNTEDQAAAFDARMQALARSRSLLGILLLREGETYQNVSANAQGFKDLDENAIAQLSAASGLPRTVFFGEPPGGLNSDGESHRLLFASLVEGERDKALRDGLVQLYGAICAQRDGEIGAPLLVGVRFNPVETLTTGEKLEGERTQADTLAALVDMNAISPEEARERAGFPERIQAPVMVMDALEDAAGRLVELPGGLPVLVEVEAGAVRNGVAPDGSVWSVVMPCCYGEIPGTVGGDGEALDVFLVEGGPVEKVFIFQIRHPGTSVYAEDKIVIGVEDGAAAAALMGAVYPKLALAYDVRVETWGDFCAEVAAGGFVRWDWEAQPLEGNMIAVPVAVSRFVARKMGIKLTPKLNWIRHQLRRGLVSYATCKKLIRFMRLTAHLRKKGLQPGAKHAETYLALGGDLCLRWLTTLKLTK